MTNPNPPQGRDVVILGSSNVDATVYLERFPQPGETVLASSAQSSLGGKGANQAVATALVGHAAGVNARFVGCVGDDGGAATVRSALSQAGVDIDALETAADVPTGAAYISVDGAGENIIIVVSGANAALSADLVDKRAAVLDGAGVGLTQGEVPAEAVNRFAALCQERGVRFVFNLAPVIAVSDETLAVADPLIVNEGEALALAGRDATELDIPGATELATWLTTHRVRSAVITLGAAGAIVADGTSVIHQPSPRPVRIVDTTGAGDAFVGAVAARLSAGDDLATAARWGVAAGSSAVTEAGASASYGGLRTLVPAEPGR